MLRVGHRDAKFNHEIPASIMTPDTVETRIGRLEFFDGFPTDATAETVFDHLDFLRGVQAFLSFVPAASLEALRIGNERLGVTAPNKILIVDDLLTSDSLFLTGNTDTVYASGMFDLSKDGPIGVEILPKGGPGLRRRGPGGLVRRPVHDQHRLADPARPAGRRQPRRRIEDVPRGLRAYPLSQAAYPPAMEFINGTGLEFNTIHSNDFEFVVVR